MSLPEALPNNISIKIPTIVYRLGKTIRGQFFNCHQALANLYLDDIIANYENLECECKDSKFTDPHHLHIITGDLSIVEQDMLRKVMQGGPNFREQPQVHSSKQLLTCIRRDIEQGIKNMKGFLLKHLGNGKLSF